MYTYLNLSPVQDFMTKELDSGHFEISSSEIIVLPQYRKHWNHDLTH